MGLCFLFSLFLNEKFSFFGGRFYNIHLNNGTQNCVQGDRDVKKDHFVVFQLQSIFFFCLLVFVVVVVLLPQYCHVPVPAGESGGEGLQRGPL